MPQSLKRLWYRPRALNLGFEMSMNPSLKLEGPQSGSESLTGHVLKRLLAPSLLNAYFGAILGLLYGPKVSVPPPAICFV